MQAHEIMQVLKFCLKRFYRMFSGLIKELLVVLLLKFQMRNSAEKLYTSVSFCIHSYKDYWHQKVIIPSKYLLIFMEHIALSLSRTKRIFLKLLYQRKWTTLEREPDLTRALSTII